MTALATAMIDLDDFELLYCRNCHACLDVYATTYDYVGVDALCLPCFLDDRKKHGEYKAQKVEEQKRDLMEYRKSAMIEGNYTKIDNTSNTIYGIFRWTDGPTQKEFVTPIGFHRS